MSGDAPQKMATKLNPEQSLFRLQSQCNDLEIALNSVEEAIVKADVNGIICWHNAAFLRLLHPDSPASVSTLCGTNLIQSLVLVNHNVQLSPQEHPAFLGLSASLPATEYEFDQKGKILILEIIGTRLEEQSKERSVLLIIRDVTEQKLIERLLHIGHVAGDPVTGSSSGSGGGDSSDHAFYESVAAYLSNYEAVGRLARLFTHMMLQLKTHEQESEKAKDQLRAVLNAVPGLISWISSDATYLGVNSHLAQMFNLAPEDFIGQKLGFIQEDTLMNEFLRKFIISPRTYNSTTIELEIDKDLRHYIIAVQKYDQGNAIVAVGIDITEQKRIEEALILAEANYRSIFENSLEGIFQSTLEGQYIRVNLALAQIYGYDSPEEMMANISNIGEQIYVDMQERQNFIRFLDQQDTVKAFEYRCYKKDRSIIWIQADARVVRDNSGQILYYEGVVQDITDRKQREAELQQQIKNLRIEIDHQKREEEVLNLTATSYFQQVKQEIEEIDLDEFWT